MEPGPAPSSALRDRDRELEVISAAITAARSGFGTTVIRTHAAAAFSGSVDIEFQSEGLQWVLTAPRNTMERD